MSNATLRREGAPLTGGKVLMICVAFFGTIFGVDALMAFDAISTFRGEVTAHPYEKGLAYNSDIEAAKAQGARDWRVDVSFAADGPARTARIAFTDPSGRPVEGLAVAGVFEAPADVRRDKSFTLQETTPGTYVGQASPSRGVWDFEITAAREGQTLFRSKNRVSLD
jgi:nitrogen fixation protein FixH